MRPRFERAVGFPNDSSSVAHAAAWQASSGHLRNFMQHTIFRIRRGASLTCAGVARSVLTEVCR